MVARTLTLGLAVVCSSSLSAHAGDPCKINEVNGIERFGQRVVADGVTIVTAAGGEIELQQSAHVFRADDGELQLATVLSSGVINGQNSFGSANALYGATFVATDDLEEIPNCSSSGAAYVYRQVDGAWVLEQKITSPDCDAGDRFGRSAAIFGDTLVVGDTRHDVDDIEDAGAAYVFHRQDGKWIYETTLLDPHPFEEDHFGHAVAIVDNVIIVGAHVDFGPGMNTGGAFVFRRTNDNWELEQSLKPSDADKLPSNKWFGTSVTLDSTGTFAVIGAIEDLNQNGSAYIFEYTDGAWHETAKIFASKEFGPWAFFGVSAAISDDLDTILIGAPLDFEAGGQAGAVHLFRRIDGEWNEVYKFTEPGTSSLGGSIGLLDDIAYVGESGGPNGDGAIHILAGINDIDCNDNGVPDACDIHSGTSLDTDGDGVPDECDPSPDLNGDQAVNVDDLLVLLGAWGSPGADLDLNGTTDVSDLLMLLDAWGPLFPTSDCPGTEDCCTPHGSPGCNDETCCQSICTDDPYCCEVQWDQVCAIAAQDACGCPGPPYCGAGAGDCCEFNGLDGPGCDDESCCETVCTFIDAFCCETQWDAMCAQWALQFCDCPPAACNPNAGSCCESNDAGPPGCNNVMCCQIICEMDAFCCEIAWDGICTEQANEYCKVCGGDPPGR